MIFQREIETIHVSNVQLLHHSQLVGFGLLVELRMRIEVHEPGSAVTSGGGLGTDDTTSTEVVEPSSFVATGDSLPVHRSSSKITACPGDNPDKPRDVQIIL